MISALGLMPWDRAGLPSAPGSLVLTLRLGEAPPAIPASLDVREHRAEAAGSFGIARIDRLLGHFSDQVRISRVYRPAAGRFDDLEHGLGLAATFRVDVDEQCPIVDLVESLRQVNEVEQAAPRWLCSTPFGTAAPEITDMPPAVPDERARQSRQQVHADEALAYEPGDSSTVVAVCDTGIAETPYAELDRRVRQGVDTVQLGSGMLSGGLELHGDTRDQDLETQDELGHGTACAAIIGAAGRLLPAGIGGICVLMPIRVLGSASFRHGRRIGVGALIDIDCGVKLAVDLGAKVLNLSFGVPLSALAPGDPLPHAEVIRYALARGCILVAASGNSGITERYLPADLDGVIAVGAVDDEDRPAAFSTRGDHVAVCAPGVRIVSANAGGEAMVTGTSFAAPFVSGAAALLVSRAARRATPLNSRDVRDLLYRSARPFAARTNTTGCGSGVLDIEAALYLLDDAIDSGGLRAPPDAARIPPTTLNPSDRNQRRTS
jgi:subtilisin family serine protease